MFFSFKVYYFPILLVQALFVLSLRTESKYTFDFRSIRARRPFDRRSEIMSNQFADVSFVVSLGSSRNAPSHKERREVCSALYHCKKHMLE